MEKQYGLYLWINHKEKIWTTTQEDDGVFRRLYEEGVIDLVKFKTTLGRMERERQIDKEGYLYTNEFTFTIGLC